jgi:GNAT superfamily N-acetyltransferase
LSIVGQYMTQFGDVESVREFRDSGFDYKRVAGAIEYSVVRTEADYREVLNLRYLAYLADGKINSSAVVNDVSDIHDSRARILMCKFRGKTIASARLTFHGLGDVTEHEQFISWPNAFPRRDDTVEVTRACTHPDFRRTGLFFALVRYVVMTAAQAGRNWVVTSSTEDLVPLYRFVGLKDAGIAYNHPDLNDLKHIVLIADTREALTGRSVGPTAWNQVYRDALQYQGSTHAIGQDTVSRIRIAVYRSLGPLLGPISSAVVRLRSIRPKDSAT